MATATCSRRIGKPKPSTMNAMTTVPNRADAVPPTTALGIALPDWIDEVVDWQRAHATPEERMRLAIRLSRENVERETGGPFGAAVFESASGTLVAVGVNSVERLTNSALHAELAAAYGALAQDLGNGLDVLGEASLYAPVPAPEPQPDFLTDRQVGELLGVSAKTVHRMAEDGRLPAPIRISPKRVRWRRGELDQRLAGEAEA